MNVPSAIIWTKGIEHNTGKRVAIGVNPADDHTLFIF